MRITLVLLHMRLDVETSAIVLLLAESRQI